MTPQTPERCGQRHVQPSTNTEYRCSLAADHHGGCHMDIENNATWSGAGDLVEHASATPVPADGACGASLVFSPTGRAYSCGLPMGHANTSHYDGKENAHWSAMARDAKTAMPGDAVQRSALAGIARHIEDMRHVFAELLAATCTGCPIVANSSNPEDGADIEPQPSCPVHGEAAELRRSLDWSAQQQDRIATALGPEYLAPFGPDVTTEVLRLIELGRQYEGLQR